MEDLERPAPQNLIQPLLSPRLSLDLRVFSTAGTLLPYVNWDSDRQELSCRIPHMAAGENRRKRKASPPASKPDESFGDADLEGVLSQDDESDFETPDSEADSDFEGLDEGAFSDASSDKSDVLATNGMNGDEPNYRVVTDANGDERYEYPEIDPVYDSDDTDAGEQVNTIGDIPLSFYDSYPHIGYSLDGKKIMRPAAGDALDALLDSVEVPKDWTGLTDPATGKPLKISKDELEILRKIQLNEIPEDGYDPYPVRHPLFPLLIGIALLMRF